MRRFYIQPQTSSGLSEISLNKEESRHITKVLRLKQGTDIELYDGTGFLYQGRILDIGKTVLVQVHSRVHIEPLKPAIILHTGLLKNKKMEIVLQKATELGVHEVHLFRSDHTHETTPSDKKMDRFQKIILESCKQSERIYPMNIFGPTSLASQLEATANVSQRFLFWEREPSNDPSSIGEINTSQDIHIFTGPEGGFSTEEIETLAPDIQTISLGKQILRAETAVIAGVSIISFLAGRFKP